ncbi:MAG: tRNA (N6-threonylcarbamoyladenosine(37)-N6)-methyltransferase TrmO [Acidobacteriaceae bacterium]
MDNRVAEIVLRPIGFIRTPFTRTEGTPIQSRFADGVEGTVDLLPEFAPGLRDIEGFDRLWLLFAFDRASDPRLAVRPYLDTDEHGVFATRSPARPNRLGISSVRLLRVEGNRLHVADVDILDGTPLLDIKPCVPAFDYLPATRIGWLEGRQLEGGVADGRFEREGSTIRSSP